MIRILRVAIQRIYGLSARHEMESTWNITAKRAARENEQGQNPEKELSVHYSGSLLFANDTRTYVAVTGYDFIRVTGNLQQIPFRWLYSK